MHTHSKKRKYLNLLLIFLFIMIDILFFLVKTMSTFVPTKNIIEDKWNGIGDKWNEYLSITVYFMVQFRSNTRFSGV